MTFRSADPNLFERFLKHSLAELRSLRSLRRFLPEDVVGCVYLTAPSRLSCSQDNDSSRTFYSWIDQSASGSASSVGLFPTAGVEVV